MRTTLIATLVMLSGLLTLPPALQAQLPSPTYGWNLGNTLEPPSGEGSWGPCASRALISSVAKAGFNTVRIPCAWDSHANQSSYEIDPAWMSRVKQVVNWCLAENLHVVLNCHWDNGWLENHITDKVNPVIDAKLRAYWTQIAVTFRDYDERLLFAGANEPAVETAAQMDTLLLYYRTFIQTVRSSGGNNRSRWLVIQGPATDIDKTDTLMNTLPGDPTPGRLAVEVHYYSPYPWCLMTEDASWGKMTYFWGRKFHHPARLDRNEVKGGEAYLEAQLRKMKTKFIDHGIPVLIGEFQAMKRTGSADLTGADLERHLASRAYFHNTMVSLANEMGMKPIYWDIPGQLFDWSTGATTDPDNKRALTACQPLRSNRTPTANTP